MLKLAYPYEDKLNSIWQSVIFNDRYKFYNFSDYWSYKIELDKSSWSKIQMISVDESDSILGYMACTCDRTTNKIDSVSIINFGNINLSFSKDLHKFLDNLFTVHSFNKIEWCVAIGNPAELMYDKIIKKYGGHIVGVQHQSTKLYDGNLCDVKEYELFRDSYLMHKI